MEKSQQQSKENWVLIISFPLVMRSSEKTECNQQLLEFLKKIEKNPLPKLIAAYERLKEDTKTSKDLTLFCFLFISISTSYL
jgi:hypothetical protein